MPMAQQVVVASITGCFEHQIPSLRFTLPMWPPNSELGCAEGAKENCQGEPGVGEEKSVEGRRAGAKHFSQFHTKLHVILLKWIRRELHKKKELRIPADHLGVPSRLQEANRESTSPLLQLGFHPKGRWQNGGGGLLLEHLEEKAGLQLGHRPNAAANRLT
jgi:hypothetical protein